MRALRLTLAWSVTILGVAVLALAVARLWLVEPLDIEWLDPVKNPGRPGGDSDDRLLLVNGILLLIIGNWIADTRDRLLL